jgi:hypothetical protein
LNAPLPWAIQYLHFKDVGVVHAPVGGRLAIFQENWHKLTKDPWILNTIMGYEIDLLEKLEQQF